MIEKVVVVGDDARVVVRLLESAEGATCKRHCYAKYTLDYNCSCNVTGFHIYIYKRVKSKSRRSRNVGNLLLMDHYHRSQFQLIQ